MNKLVKASMISLAAVAVLSMTGCGGSSSSNGDSNSTTKVKAADGYINGATVCLDLNGDGQCNDGNQVKTNANGDANLTITPKQLAQAENNRSISIIINGGTDIDDPTLAIGTLKAPFATGKANVTPLTTMIQSVLENNSSLGVGEAAGKVAKAFGLQNVDVNDLMGDPVVLKKTKPQVTKAAMTIHRVVLAILAKNSNAKVTDVYSKLAKVVATKDLNESNVTSFINTVQADLNSTYVVPVQTIAKIETTIDTVVEKNDTSKLKALDKLILPVLTFGKIKFFNTKNPSEQNETNLTSGANGYTFAETNITKNSNSNISDFNLTLGNINVSNNFIKQTATLSIKVVDDSNNSKNISLSIPEIVIDGNTTDFNITIPKDANATFKQSEVNITSKNTTNYIFSKTEVFKSQSKDNNLSISVGSLLTDMNVSDNTKNNLNNYFDKNRSYDITIGFEGIDKTRLVAPTKISGKVGIINK